MPEFDQTDVFFRCPSRGLTFARVNTGQTLADIPTEQTARCLLPGIPLMQGGSKDRKDGTCANHASSKNGEKKANKKTE